MSNTSAKPQRSLKGALRSILLKCRRNASEDTPSTVGSGILRSEPSLPILPNDSTTAFLSGLESTRYDDHDDENEIPDRFDISSLATSAAMSSTHTLMPKISLSQFEIYHPPIQEVKYLQRGRSDSIASSLAEGASYQASLLSSFRSSSTLRIQRSSQTLRSESEQSFPHSSPDRTNRDLDTNVQTGGMLHCPSPPRTSHNLSPRRSVLRKRASMGTVSSPSPLRQTQPAFDLDLIDGPYSIPYNYSSRFAKPLSVIDEVASHLERSLTPRRSPVPQSLSRSRTSTRTPTRTPTPLFLEPPILRSASVKSDATNPLLSVKAFSSFCALDTVAPGRPVIATSRDLKYIFELGDRFCLNNQECDGVSMDIITGSDTAGNPVTHLVLFSPLIIPHSGRSRFMLASLVDVTSFIHDTASLPELEMVSEESVESSPPTPTCQPQPFLRTPKYRLSDESLLGGCFVDEPRTPVQRYDEDIWLNLATEERKQYAQQTRMNIGASTPMSATSTLSSFDEILDNFMCKLQELHSEFFLLAKSPLDDTYYEICNVSPRVYHDRDYVNGHLSKTSANDMNKLSGQLAGDEAFSMRVKWGAHGVAKHLYCTPLFARSAVTWICFLVAEDVPVLW